MREMTSAPNADCGLSMPASAMHTPSVLNSFAASVVVPMSIAAPNFVNAGDGAGMR